MKRNTIWNIVIIAVVVLLVATVLGCGCTGGISPLGVGAACGCMPGLGALHGRPPPPPHRRRMRNKEDFSLGKVGEFIGAAGALAGLGVADVVGSTARWGAGEVMDGMRHAAGWVEGKDVKPIKHDSFWIW